MINNFKLRSVREEDLEDLFELSQIVTFINLPADKEIILKKIRSSQKSFENPSEDKSKNWYIFVLEDLKIKKVIGVSMIHAQHGTDFEPHFYLSVGQETKYSETINTGFTHGTLKLGLNTDGPSEIGGLVLHPDYRGNTSKLGKQLSFVRFLYISQYKERFKEFIHSELMPPLDQEGNSPLWEAIGRRFMNMDYQEADVLSRNNKEFILSLFPSDNIYMTLLPVEARQAIGQVGKETLPVKNMLEKVGFEYTGEVDPFDGGPHYRAHVDRIKPVQEASDYKIEWSDDFSKDDQISSYLLSYQSEKYDFISGVFKGVKKGETLFLIGDSEFNEAYGFKLS